jgi:hypothetical protein
MALDLGVGIGAGKEVGQLLAVSVFASAEVLEQALDRRGSDPSELSLVTVGGSADRRDVRRNQVPDRGHWRNVDGFLPVRGGENPSQGLKLFGKKGHMLLGVGSDAVQRVAEPVVGHQ